VKFAAIDIGSNGARLLISSVLNEEKENFSFKDVEYTRFPLRLGKDVFEDQKINNKKREQLIKLMQAFKLLIELHEVDDYMAVATSAFREAKNGEQIIKEVKEKTGVKIEVIEGAKEAEILHYVISQQLTDFDNYLHIDVGGGSTEINIYANRQKIASRSFAMGSIRNVGSKKNIEILKNMQEWLQVQLIPLQNMHVTAIGTGGNINKSLSLLKIKNQMLTKDQLRKLQLHLNTLSFHDKVNLLELNPDRADTIVPALTIYLSIMEWANVDTMQVPEVGLKDGMMIMMWQKYLANGRV
jgi:exopolyphosphatase / guanosine-5'-triphosphate,3'-diphosphate pyrophosphatase